jgi:hypothetical protein
MLWRKSVQSLPMISRAISDGKLKAGMVDWLQDILTIDESVPAFALAPYFYRIHVRPETKGLRFCLLKYHGKQAFSGKFRTPPDNVLALRESQ